MVFYRKYRPQTLAELDNRRVAETLGKYLMRDSIPHAFLFTGSKGTGKTSTARILAKSVNCPKAQHGQACGACDVCVSIAEGTNLDILEIDAASNRGIDEIRDLREKIKLTPTNLTYKVYIIDEVHMLTSEAFNALLKTLEEPPKHALFILATTEAHKVPETIGSRCVKIDFHKATTEELMHALHRIVVGEKLTISDDALRLVAEASDGSFRDGAKLLQQVAVEDGPITREKVEEVAGLTDVRVRDDFLRKLQQKNTKALLVGVQQLSQSGRNIPQFFQNILQTLEGQLVDLFSTGKSEWTKDELVRALTLFSEAFPQVKSAVLPTLPFEIAIVEYCDEPISVTKVTKKPATVEEESLEATTTSDGGTVGPILAKWPQFLEGMKQHNHSIVGVLRSCKPVSLTDGVLTIEAQYKFHAERISDARVRDLIAKVVKDVVGLDVKINTVLKKR